jgi:excisionase family DNA binding protein
MATTPATTTNDPTRITSTTIGELLSAPDVGKILNVSEHTVRFWIADGRLLSLKIGRRRFVQRKVLDEFLARELAKAGGR